MICSKICQTRFRKVFYQKIKIPEPPGAPGTGWHRVEHPAHQNVLGNTSALKYGYI
jgi:hypothetical protein